MSKHCYMHPDWQAYKSSVFKHYMMIIVITITSMVNCHHLAVLQDPEPLQAAANTTEQPKFDVCIANILRGPLLDLQPRLCSYLKPGGALLLSGILTSQARPPLLALLTLHPQHQSMNMLPVLVGMHADCRLKPYFALALRRALTAAIQSGTLPVIGCKHIPAHIQQQQQQQPVLFQVPACFSSSNQFNSRVHKLQSCCCGPNRPVMSGISSGTLQLLVGVHIQLTHSHKQQGGCCR